MCLKNKKILITAGSTWVPIDNVRVISNIATGQTGLLLSSKANRLGAKVTLLLGPVSINGLDLKNSIKIMHFNFFDELKSKLITELKSHKYDVVVHSAAVSDYKLKRIFRHKISSGKKNLMLSLIPTAKILDFMKRIDPNLAIIAFKFEPDIQKNQLINRAKRFLQHSDVDLVVANTINHKGYMAYLIYKNKIEGPIFSKDSLTDKLIDKIGDL